MVKPIDPKILSVIQRLRLFDDTFMSCVFEDNIEGVALLLHILLERDDLSVKQVTAQKKYTNLLGHSVWLDIVAEDKDSNLYNIEVQRGNEGANSRRARYHSSMLDSRLLAKGEDYTALADSYVIFITERDVFHKGLPLYHFERTLQEGGELLGDGSHILYVNGAYQDLQSPVGRLMHDFRCPNADEMLHPVLAERVRYLKEDEGGRNSMCDLVRDLVKELAVEEIAKMQRETAEEMAKKEREAAEKLARREREAAEKLARREREAAEKLARRERETAEEMAKRERETAEEMARREREAAEEIAKKERETAEETTRKERKETALTLLGFGLLTYEKIAEASRLTVEEIKVLDAQRTA